MKAITGLMTALTSPIIMPAIRRSMSVPSKIKPGMSLAAIKIAAALANMRIINFIAVIKTFISLAGKVNAVKKESYFEALSRLFMMISLKAKTFLPETGILGFFLTSLFSALVFLGFMG